MNITGTNLQTVSGSKDIRMGTAYAKQSNALFLSKYSKHCNERLKDICFVSKGTSITENDTEDGAVPVVAGGKDFAYYHSTSNRNGNVITISASGANSGFVNYWEMPIWASDCTTVISKDEDNYLTKFLYYELSLIQSDFYLMQKGTDQPHVYPDDIQYIRIPDVPIDKQREALNSIIVLEKAICSQKDRIISLQGVIDSVFQREFGFDYDAFDHLKAQKMYEAKSMTFANNPDLRFSAQFHRPAGDFVMQELTGITDKRIKHFLAEPIVLGASISPSDFDENGTAYYVSMATIKSLEVELDDSQLVSPVYYDAKQNKTLQVGDIVVARSGVAIGKAALVKETFDGVFADFTMRIRLDKTKYIPLFAYYYFRTKYFQYLIECYKKGLQNQNIFPIVMQEFPIPDISLVDQQRVVNEIQAEVSKQDDVKKQVAELRSQIDDTIVCALKWAG